MVAKLYVAGCLYLIPSPLCLVPCVFFLVPYIATMKSILVFVLLPLTLLAQQTKPPAVCDILIRNGKIIDGSGNNWYYGDIAVKDGKIIKIGRTVNLSAKKTIDAKGLIIAPGFIDVHTHLEDDEVKDPNATSFILDGV